MADRSVRQSRQTLRRAIGRAFTLIELLVVVSIIALLVSILMPALSRARSHAKAAVCMSNLHQLVLASLGYAAEWEGHFVPAAEDMLNPIHYGGLCRWHGKRQRPDESFDPLESPLRNYLADGAVKECPGIHDFIKADDWDSSFEKGCGGYGYNMTYLGSMAWKLGTTEAAFATTPRLADVRDPAGTLMFTDTAMDKGRGYIEYSFAEQPMVVMMGTVFPDRYMSPTIHFRHLGRANVAWVDGHVDNRQPIPFDSDNVYGVPSTERLLGWFEPLDNSWFDLR